MAAVATSSGSQPVAAAAFGLQAGGWEPAASHPRYWPAGLLPAFILQMAAQGRCINESMMLGSREYAIEKLTLAHTLDDALLREMSVQMFSYFDDEPIHAVALLTGQTLAH